MKLDWLLLLMQFKKIKIHMPKLAQFTINKSLLQSTVIIQGSTLPQEYPLSKLMRFKSKITVIKIYYFYNSFTMESVQ
jgi:hypothetical protein